MMTYHTLQIKDLELEVNLGWPKTEREKRQLVLVNISIFFYNEVLAASTDELKDTVCYAELIEILRKEISDKSFKLIEYLTQFLKQILNQQLPKASVTVSVTKFPNIPGLKGGVQFSCGESD